MADINLQVEASGDDGVTRISGPTKTFDNSSSTHYIGYRTDFPGGAYGAFALFDNVTIPQGAIINSAHLTFTASGSLSGTTANSNIWFNNVDDATAPTTYNEWDGLAVTSGVTWTFGSWTSDTEYSSPDLASILQEVIDREGWNSGGALQIKTQNAGGTAYRRWHSFDGDETKAPKLDITYTASSSAPNVNDSVTITESSTVKINELVPTASDTVTLSENVTVETSTVGPDYKINIASYTGVRVF